MSSNHGGRREGAGRKAISNEPMEQIKVLLPASAKRRLTQKLGDHRVGPYLRSMIEEAEIVEHEEWAIWEYGYGFRIGLYSCEEEAEGALKAAREREPNVRFGLSIWPHPPADAEAG